MKTQYQNHGFMLLLVGVLFTGPAVHAAPADEAMSRAQFMIRQISAERDQLQSDKASLKKQLDEIQKKYDGLENKSSKTSGDMKQQFTQLRELYETERKEHEATRTSLAAIVAEKNQLTDVASGQGQGLELCMTNNKKLYDVTQNMLTAYEDKSAWDGLMQREPFTGLSQIEIENMVDDTQYNMDVLRVDAELLTNKTSN